MNACKYTQTFFKRVLLIFNIVTTNDKYATYAIVAVPNTNLILNYSYVIDIVFSFTRKISKAVSCM